MRVSLSLTQQCNLACRYCYASPSVDTVMTVETAKKIIDFALSLSSEKEKLDFSFFGGEPLLKFDLIKEITPYIQNRAKEEKKDFEISITTNGTILHREILDFLQEKNIHLCFSIDGPPDVHNQNRKYKNGRGSLEVIIKNLHTALANLNSVQVNAVYGPDTLTALPSSVEFLYELGARVIHLNLNINSPWESSDLARFPEVYNQIGEYYIQRYKSNQEVAINLIDSKIILFLGGGYTSEDLCSMGEREWGFARSGNIYPCERFIGGDINAAFCLGNINSGLDVKRQAAVVSQRGNTNRECQKCNLNQYCMNWCGCTNYYMTGQTNHVSPTLCASERAVIKTAEQVLQRINRCRMWLVLRAFYAISALGAPPLK